MNWMQAILTILLGNLIVLIPMLLNAHTGTKFVQLTRQRRSRSPSAV
jgi:cytosine/uracil/thiamine/allantoin permease